MTDTATGSFIGRDGAITLAAALAATVLSVGAAPAAATAAVMRRAWRTPVRPPLRPARTGHPDHPEGDADDAEAWRPADGEEVAAPPAPPGRHFAPR